MFQVYSKVIQLHTNTHTHTPPLVLFDSSFQTLKAQVHYYQPRLSWQVD